MAYKYYYKSLYEIIQRIINNLHETIPEASTAEGTFLRNMLNPVADEITALYGDMEILKNNQSIIFATGDDLDLLAANYFVVRKPATKSSGKLRFYIKEGDKKASELTDEDIPEIITIPIGTKVSTISGYNRIRVNFETTELAYYTREQIINLPLDYDDTGFRFIEVAAQSVDAGEYCNVAAGEITIINDSLKGISWVNNPFPFTGGVDRENDADLTYRVQLAVTGCNIGTKDGYIRYILEQPSVIAAYAAGAGDPLMFRDGGYIDDDGQYHWGEGGCVDIYVRGLQAIDDTYYAAIDSNYLATTPNIVLPNQPITDILNITSTVSNTIFINAADYDKEKYVYMKNGIMTTEYMYCIDILWDFSLTDSFPDTEYYSTPIGYTAAQLEQLKLQLDNELLDAREYMTNINYALNWATTRTSNITEGSTALFNKIYINNSVYKLQAKDDSHLDNRVFILRNDQIYVRAYVQPDYIIEKDNTMYSGGITGKDSIKWLNTSKLLAHDLLRITYNYNFLINLLQLGIEDQKCLTADVLVKSATEVPIEIIADINIYNTTTIANAKSIIASDISVYIRSNYRIGGELDRSDIVNVIKQCQHVNRVDIDTIKLSRKGQATVDIITLANNEYFTLSAENLILNITIDNVVNA